MFFVKHNQYQLKGTTRWTDLVQAPSNVNRRLLDNSIDDLRERGQEVGRVNFRVEKDFRCKEALISDIDAIWLRGTRQNPVWRSAIRVR